MSRVALLDRSQLFTGRKILHFANERIPALQHQEAEEDIMRDRKEDLPLALYVPRAVMSRVAEWGEQAVAYVELSAGTDTSPLLDGLPGNSCPCPHWGYVLEGAVHVQYSDGRRETSWAGDIFYWRPGHTLSVDEYTAFVAFSPRRQRKEVCNHIDRMTTVASLEPGNLGQ